MRHGSRRIHHAPAAVPGASPRFRWLLIFIAVTAVSATTTRAQYDTRVYSLPLVPPGTVIGDRPAAPWSHLILKSNPRVTHGDLNRVGRRDVEMSSLMSTSLLARIEKSGDGQFRLAEVATGISTDIGGRDVVITPTTQKSLGAGLGFLQRMVLNEFYKETMTIRVIGRSNTIWLFDTPIVLRFEGKNRDSILRYAVLVDSATGRLETLCWPIHMDSQGDYHGVSGAMQWLAPNTIVDCQLYVDASEYNAIGIPSKTAFACVNVPPGQIQIVIPPKVGQLLSRKRPSADEIRIAHQWLSQAVRQAQAALPRSRPN